MSITQPKKLLIVDDSAFMRKMISDFFGDHPHIKVIGTARNGKDAIRKIQMLKPDVVTMDVEMPEMNGLEALKVIMKECPVPVVMLSSTTKSGAKITLEAMASGAVDFVAKPSGPISLDLYKIQSEVIRIVENAATVHVSKLRHAEQKDLEKTTIPKEKVSTLSHSSVNTKDDIQRGIQVNPPVKWNSHSKKMVLIGTSTGGPRALQEVITRLPQNIPAPILIVQHMPEGFTKSLANRLDQLAKITVKEAEQGDILQAGVAYIAPGGFHLHIRKVGMSYCIELDQSEPPRGGHRPSVDVMFEDNSKYNDFDKIAVIMTGMGSDGTKGLQALKNNGNVIAITESADTCVVYGMPKSAYATGLVDEVADVDDISNIIMKYLP
ncbi:chemotaxis response regulator protein-glutamate methylesterase [Rummeliibacillus pycnus]|uniref:chemotaxis response regulator protein-glutamate methylesterase n=1 Tax=Rummeliibacillus pycnus TaxID=101070 RepID=UPI0037C7AA41